MHNPEVIKFPAPECRLSYGCYDWGEKKGEAWHSLVDRHPFNTKVSLLMPDSPTFPASLKELLTEDTQFYRINDLHLYEFCAPAFLQAFLTRGKLFALSCDTLLDVDNSAAITPDGILRLLVDRLTYQELPLSGQLSATILRTPPEKYIVEVDLKKPNFHFGRPYYQRVLKAFTQVPLSFNFWLMWVPDDPTVCPSSIAKYFHDLGCSVMECWAELSQRSQPEALMPSPDLATEESEVSEEKEDHRTEPEDLLEWIGCQTLGIQLSSSESVLSGVVEPTHGTPVKNLRSAQCSGLFPPSFIHLLIEQLRAWLEQRDAVAVPWVGLTVYGHPDAVVSWGRQEHTFHTTGDNLYVLVLTRKQVLAYQLQGSAKPQRLYVKTNKNKG